MLAVPAGDHGERFFHAVVAAHVVELGNARKPLACASAVLAAVNGRCGGEIAAFVPVDVIGGFH